MPVDDRVEHDMAIPAPLTRTSCSEYTIYYTGERKSRVKT